MRYFVKNEETWSHFDIEKTNKIYINGNPIEVECLQGKFYALFPGESSRQRIYTHQNSNKPTIIANSSVQFFQGFIPRGLDHKNSNSLMTAMPGKIIKVFVAVGEEVKKNQTLVILEAMKMENEIKATKDGLVKEIFVKENQLVDSNIQLMEIL